MLCSIWYDSWTVRTAYRASASSACPQDSVRCSSCALGSSHHQVYCEPSVELSAAAESVDVEAVCSQYPESVHVAASLLKNFFMSLPEPLFPFVLYDEIHAVVSAGVLTAPVVKCIVDKVRCSPFSSD
jgi:hypothetical protein